MIHPSHDTASLWLPEAKNTALAGENLARTFYSPSVTLFLHGEVGAGKTTFLQGLAKGLGIEEYVTSPTFALEQRYETAKGIPFTHLDLYRLSEAEARHFMRETPQEGIRCIEWAERLGEEQLPGIHLTLAEEGNGRRLTIDFADLPLPTEAMIAAWRKEVRLPPSIVAHCEAVAHVCDTLATILLQRSIPVRPLALKRAAQLHDLFRFADFKPSAAPSNFTQTAEEEAHWNTIKQRYNGARHEKIISLFLQAQNFPELAEIVESHGFRTFNKNTPTTEQAALFYADKRAQGDLIVSVHDRFADFDRRYGPSEERDSWLAATLDIEKTLFGGAPEIAPYGTK